MAQEGESGGRMPEAADSTLLKAVAGPKHEDVLEFTHHHWPDHAAAGIVLVMSHHQTDRRRSAVRACGQKHDIAIEIPPAGTPALDAVL